MWKKGFAEVPAELAPEATDASKGLEELRKLFDALDQDHDGNVTGREWGKKVKENQALLAKYFGGSTLKDIGSAFKRIDTDGNASLTWEEFVAAAGLELPAASSPRSPKPMLVARAALQRAEVAFHTGIPFRSFSPLSPLSSTISSMYPPSHVLVYTWLERQRGCAHTYASKSARVRKQRGDARYSAK